MKVSELIEKLKKCNPDDRVEVSVDFIDTPPEHREFAECIGINEITKESLVSIVLLCEGKTTISGHFKALLDAQLPRDAELDKIITENIEELYRS
jgi:hypothetical protein